MGQFKEKSDYFKSLCVSNKLVAHTVNQDGEVRNSYFRMNDEDELVAACVNWAHFPCVVHFSFYGRYRGQALIAKRQQTSILYFLDKADASDMDSIENAYDLAFEVMEQFISKMNNEFLEDGSCSPFRNLDLSRFSYSAVGPINATLFGWMLQFEDEASAEDVTNYDETKWY
jgi:hypothetical protein